ncbi:hypothetical protein BDZ89DRAFT_1049363 [Hymenopellis radicata]|nr:hypothetical protein BDZ89DRAFT_1049363 [Hymenopellis radicata]
MSPFEYLSTGTHSPKSDTRTRVPTRADTPLGIGKHSISECLSSAITMQRSTQLITFSIRSIAISVNASKRKRPIYDKYDKLSKRPHLEKTDVDSAEKQDVDEDES